LSFGLLVLFAISVGDLFRKTRRQRQESSHKPRFAAIGADKYRQDVRLRGAMQPALPKIRGIPATLRQSCSRFRVPLLAFNQGF
jgi:hypothetical protein